MERFKIEFVLHWLWAAVFGLMLVSGIALLGPRYGWALNYNLALADYLHRSLAVVLTIILFAEIILELRRIFWFKSKRAPWLVIGKKGFAVITFIASYLLILSGILLWLCTDNHALMAFASVVHEMVTFAMVFGMIWHIYDKSHILTLGGGHK